MACMAWIAAVVGRDLFSSVRREIVDAASS
jgi:hypothetical protein